MATDDERRRVAERLRATAKWLGGNMDAHEFAHYGADAIDPDNEIARWDEMTYRLADLIEPSCDREALLELAGELEGDACWEVQSPGVDNYAWMLKDVCERIREALGVES
ncbi:hypothetical protein B5G20_05025 [Collinsella sp. An7]|uniref:hypothetical protein n=1 Tax=Collinsella sp. An7 TaxID=1965651 RepID=UPI000B3A1D0F|nr:hypothetical protein [Collinsella sp. An7]OUN47330.1 hypothetical protein B5G20_05025 [Collinsella sp. An7]